MPLRHIGSIVIWEGNYKSDIFNIGTILIIISGNRADTDFFVARAAHAGAFLPH